MGLELPQSSGWEEVDIHHALLRIVAMVSGRVFIGPELCRNEEYLDSAINYTMDVMAAQRAVQTLNPWLRPILAGRLPQVKKLNERVVEAQRFINSVLEVRKEVLADPTSEKPFDMIQWLIDGKSKFPDEKSQNLAKVQLGLTFAAVHTTALTATNA